MTRKIVFEMPYNVCVEWDHCWEFVLCFDWTVMQVSNQEMVSLVREPHNRYDTNAVKVDNVSGIQVGHIKQELAKPLSRIIDRRLARVEGSVTLSSILDILVCASKLRIVLLMVDKLATFSIGSTAGLQPSQRSL